MNCQKLIISEISKILKNKKKLPLKILKRSPVKQKATFHKFHPTISHTCIESPL